MANPWDIPWNFEHKPYEFTRPNGNGKKERINRESIGQE